MLRRNLNPAHKNGSHSTKTPGSNAVPSPGHPQPIHATPPSLNHAAIGTSTTAFQSLQPLNSYPQQQSTAKVLLAPNQAEGLHFCGEEHGKESVPGGRTASCQRQQQGRDGGVGSYALPLNCLSEDSSDGERAGANLPMSTEYCSVLARPLALEGVAHGSKKFSPAVHKRGPVRVQRCSISSKGASTSILSSHKTLSDPASKSQYGYAGNAADPNRGQAARKPDVAVARSAVGSARAKAAQVKLAQWKIHATQKRPPNVTIPNRDLDNSKTGTLRATSWSSLSKLALLVSVLMAVPATLWAVNSATTAASLLSALGCWSRSGPKLAPAAGSNPQLGPGSNTYPPFASSTLYSKVSQPPRQPSFSAQAHARSLDNDVSGGVKQGVRSGMGSGVITGVQQGSTARLGAPWFGGSTEEGPRRVSTQAGAGDMAGMSPYLPSIPPAASQRWDPESTVRVAVIVGRADVASPYGGAPWGEVLTHTAQRLQWTDDMFEMLVFDEAELAGSPREAGPALQGALKDGCQILLSVGVSEPSVVSMLQQQQQSPADGLPGVRLFLESPPELQNLSSLQGWAPWGSKSPMTAAMEQLLPWSGPAKTAVLWDTLQNLWQRRSSDDLLFVFLVLVNEYVMPVKEVYMTTKGTDLSSLWCMVTNCGQQIKDCVTNPVCKAGLDCLQSCQFNDQICQYRCIVAHETPAFEQFALCILQKHNCRGLTAEMPTHPDHAPIAMFRGAPLTHEAAEDILIGWMDPGRGSSMFSWLVAAGKNPAYDYFPCQHQLFTRGKGRGQLWYEPVFKVLLENQEVWRRRRYRVRRASTPGTFHFSVLDNGVVSKEFWRILDCDEAMEWVLLGYNGAASTAGLSYSGAVLGTRDGSYPSAPDALRRLESALGRAGIRPWELSYVDNSKCAGAPL